MTSTTVFIVDDDPGIRSSLALLLETANLKSARFASADEFLAVCGPTPDGCLILDVRMPGMSGLQLQDELALRHIQLPIIFLTGFAAGSSELSDHPGPPVSFVMIPFSFFSTPQ